MFNEEQMALEICVECHKEIAVGEKMVLIYRDDFVAYWVHAGQCFENYSKALTSPSAISAGYIIGICEVCLKPVRTKQEFTVARNYPPWVGITEEEVMLFNTTYPISKNGHNICFVHKECNKCEEPK